MKIILWLGRIEQTLCFAGFLLMSLSLIADVGARLFVGHGLVGAPQLGLVGMLITALFAVGITAQAGEHFRPRFLDQFCPSSWQGAVTAIGFGLTSVFFMVLFALATYVVAESRALDELTPLLRWPVWMLQGVMVVAFAFNSLRYLIYAIDPATRPVEYSETDNR